VGGTALPMLAPLLDASFILIRDIHVFLLHNHTKQKQKQITLTRRRGHPLRPTINADADAEG
jgi:hypothetical protein